VEELVTSVENACEISGSLTARTRQSLLLLSLRNLMLILSMILMREYLLSHVTLEGGLLTLEHRSM